MMTELEFTVWYLYSLNESASSQFQENQVSSRLIISRHRAVLVISTPQASIYFVGLQPA